VEIAHTKSSVLFNEDNTWGKKSAANLFDVTMGSYDGAETCELVGAFLLHQINNKYGAHFGLYRDDGLGALKLTPRIIENIKKDLCAIFKGHDLRITIEANTQTVNFLDINLNLNTGRYSPFMKPNNTPLYVHSKSNHPPGIIKNIPASINRRLSTISSDLESFSKAVPPYQDALRKSGYDHQLEYSIPITTNNGKTPGRARNITWFNPPFSKNVTTNIGKRFLQFIREEFPASNPLHKIFNPNTLKISYSCMPNIKQYIDSHNKSLIKQNSSQTPDTNIKTCNCRRGTDCPLDGNCLAKSIVYQATVTAGTHTPETYIGLTENTFKTRYTGHKYSFKHSSNRTATELSKHIWSLKDSNTNHSITWKIIKTATPYNNKSKRCSLCLWEKYYIICRPELGSLNKRNELASSCRHSAKFLLKNCKNLL
jgi:hypothetical protein